MQESSRALSVKKLTYGLGWEQAFARGPVRFGAPIAAPLLRLPELNGQKNSPILSNQGTDQPKLNHEKQT